MIFRLCRFCLLLMLFSTLTCFAAEPKPGTITGKWITKAHGPMTGGQVLLFNTAKGPAPASSKFLRLPDAGVQIDEKGVFVAELPPGRYYLVMRKRANQDSAGPPEEGDPQYYARLKNGDPKTFTVKPGKKTNIGTITEATPFKREKTAARAGMTGIEGTVTDDQGKPLAGLRVFVYQSAGMLGMPRYASDQTGEDGRYFLSLTAGGTYFLKARTHYGGGRPDEGEYMGSYGKAGEPGSVVVEKGQIVKGIDIRTTRFSSKRKGE